jgi:hypothetical protein
METQAPEKPFHFLPQAHRVDEYGGIVDLRFADRSVIGPKVPAYRYDNGCKMSFAICICTAAFPHVKFLRGQYLSMVVYTDLV